jgi:hypothetical protein
VCWLTPGGWLPTADVQQREGASLAAKLQALYDRGFVELKVPRNAHHTPPATAHARTRIHTGAAGNATASAALLTAPPAPAAVHARPGQAYWQLSDALVRNASGV